MYTILYIVKTLLMCLYMSYNNTKILKLEKGKLYKISAILYVILSILYAYINMSLQMNINTTIYATLCVSIAYIFIYKLNITYSIVISMLSMAINQVLFCISAITVYVPVRMIHITNEYLSFLLINVVQIGFLIAFWRIKRIRNGITFLKKWKDD